MIAFRFIKQAISQLLPFAVACFWLLTSFHLQMKELQTTEKIYVDLTADLSDNLI
jgi:hypothetical protein